MTIEELINKYEALAEMATIRTKAYAESEIYSEAAYYQTLEKEWRRVVEDLKNVESRDIFELLKKPLPPHQAAKLLDDLSRGTPDCTHDYFKDDA